jgi:hypothetical protein
VDQATVSHWLNLRNSRVFELLVKQVPAPRHPSTPALTVISEIGMLGKNSVRCEATSQASQGSISGLD